MRAAMKMFLEVLPVRTAHLLDELGWLAAELGKVRDLDVQLIQTAQWQEETGSEDRAGLAELANSLGLARSKARAELLFALDSRRCSRLFSGLVQMLSQSPPRRSLRCRTLAVVALPELLAADQQAARKAAKRARRSGLATDYHRLRIRCKRLRYALEFSHDCYGGATKRFARSLAALQDELGAMQDAEVAATRLRAIALAGADGLSLEAVFAIGGVAERYRRESERLLRRLAADVRVVDGAEWRRLGAVLERRRREALEQSAPAPQIIRGSPAPALRARAPAEVPALSTATGGAPSRRLGIVSRGGVEPAGRSSAPGRPAN
jgi:CHAD domain-containing protein